MEDLEAQMGNTLASQSPKKFQRSWSEKYSLDINLKNIQSIQSLSTRTGHYLDIRVLCKEIIRNAGKELCTKMFTEAVFKIAEQAKKKNLD